MNAWTVSMSDIMKLSKVAYTRVKQEIFLLWMKGQ